MVFNLDRWFSSKKETVRVKAEEEKKKTFLEYLSKWSNRTFLIGALFTAPFLASKDGLGWSSKSKENVKKGQTEHNIEKTKTYNLDAFERTHVQDSSGDTAFNPWAFISPVQMDGKIETKTVDSATTVIPYHWAETFKEIQAASPEQRDSLEKGIVRELQQGLAQSLHIAGIGTTTQEVDALKHGGMRQEGTTIKRPAIKSITITGLASPEANTPESIIPGNVDSKNLQLAENRGNDILPYVKQALANLGEDTSKIESVKVEEVQFSQSEYETIIDLASKGGYIGDTDITTGIFNFIQDYNHGKIKDSASVDQMKEILDSKRGVKLQVVTESKESKEVVVPLPLLLLLLPSVFKGMKDSNWEKFWRRKKDKEPDPIPSISKKPREIFSESTLDQGVLDASDKNFHDLYRSALETEGANYQDISRISDLVYTQEIYPYLNHAETIEKGLDYKLLVDNARNWRSLKPPHYKTDAEIKEKLAEYVLEDWQEYDRNVRKGITTSSGPDRRDLTEEEIKRTVEYRHDPSKVIWAIQAAEHIFDLSNAKNDEDLEKLMEAKRVAIEERHDVEIAGIPAKENGIQTGKETKIEEKVDQKVSKEPKVSATPEKTLEAKASVKQPISNSEKENLQKMYAERTAEKEEVVIPESNLEPVNQHENQYEQYLEDNKQLGSMMGDFAQALSQENLQKMYAERAAEKEAERKQRAPRDRINEIDTKLREIEKKLEERKHASHWRTEALEKQFNELEQEKREIQKNL